MQNSTLCAKGTHLVSCRFLCVSALRTIEKRVQSGTFVKSRHVRIANGLFRKEIQFPLYFRVALPCCVVSLRDVNMFEKLDVQKMRARRGKERNESPLKKSRKQSVCVVTRKVQMAGTNAFLSIPLKRASDVSLKEPLTTFIRNQYTAATNNPFGTDGEGSDRAEAVNEFSKLRYKACVQPLDKHESSLEVLCRCVCICK